MIAITVNGNLRIISNYKTFTVISSQMNVVVISSLTSDKLIDHVP